MYIYIQMYTCDIYIYICGQGLPTRLVDPPRENAQHGCRCSGHRQRSRIIGSPAFGGRIHGRNRLEDDGQSKSEDRMKGLWARWYSDVIRALPFCKWSWMCQPSDPHRKTQGSQQRRGLTAKVVGPVAVPPWNLDLVASGGTGSHDDSRTTGWLVPPGCRIQ